MTNSAVKVKLPAGATTLKPCGPFDTCDRCGPHILAKITVTFPFTGSNVLTLCGHHARLFGWTPEAENAST